MPYVKAVVSDELQPVFNIEGKPELWEPKEFGHYGPLAEAFGWEPAELQKCPHCKSLCSRESGKEFCKDRGRLLRESADRPRKAWPAITVRIFGGCRNINCRTCLFAACDHEANADKQHLLADPEGCLACDVSHEDLVTAAKAFLKKTALTGVDNTHFIEQEVLDKLLERA